MRLGSSKWPDFHAATPLRLLIPLGATEQHGPHLPLETDTVIAVALAEAVAAVRSDVAVAPALPFGSSGEHAGFPGTLSLGQAVLEAAVIELVRSADHFEDVVLVSWHGGNAAPLARAVARLREEGRKVSCWESRLDRADAHAGRFETSLMLAIAPALVGSARPVGSTDSLARLLPLLRGHGVRAVSPSGVLGDARGASAADGASYLSELVADLGAFLDATAVVPVPT